MGKSGWTVTLRIHGGSMSVPARPGQTLLDTIGGTGAAFSAPCGGGGRCGKCRVRASGALEPASPLERELLGKRALAAGVRLACMARPAGDCEVFLPDAAAQAETGPAAASSARPELEMSAGSAPYAGPSEAALLKAAGAAEAEPAALEKYRTLGLAEGAPFYFVRRNSRVLDAAAARPRLTGYAADIGTTTLAMRFYDLETGRALGVRGAMNPQAAFGADVLSRIAACAGSPDTLALQQRAVAGALNGMALDFCRESGMEPSGLYAAAVAGNTAMLHLLAGLDPSGLGAAPFVGRSLFGEPLPAEKLGLTLCGGARVYAAPCVSAFVGGDVTAGLLACGLDRPGGARLLLDVGTNGEMAFCRDGAILCASAAAGPAFEGAHLRCGSGGVPGAVCAVHVEKDGGLSVKTVGGAPAGSLCGSGLIDALAAMRTLGAMDKTGRILPLDEAPVPARTLLGEADGEPAFFLCRIQKGGAGAQDGAAADVFVTQRDVRQAQLAKGAVAAGIGCLLREAGCGADELTEVLLAGGFGAHLSPRSACAVGLLPESLAARTRFVGNASLDGASMALLSAAARKRLGALRGRCRTLELSGSPLFEEQFIAGMEF